MIGLLTQTTDLNIKEIKHYKLNYATSIISEYLDTIKAYYNESGFYVKRPNMLVTLLEILEINIYDTEQDVRFSLKEKSTLLADSLGIVTGREFNSEPFKDTVFDNVDEYFILAEDMTKGLTCLYTNISTLFLTHPKRYERMYDSDDYNIYAINPVELGLEYYRWANLEIKNHPEDYSVDPAKFIYVEVITNLIPDIFKHAIFNRYIRIENNTDLEEFQNFNPFYIKNIDPLVTSIQTWYLDEIKKNNSLDYQELLLKLPDFDNGNMLSVYTIPNIYFGRKGYWVLILARIDYFKFLLDTADIKRNKQYVNELKIWLKLAERKRYFEIPNYTLRYIINEKLKKLKDNL